MLVGLVVVGSLSSPLPPAVVLSSWQGAAPAPAVAVLVAVLVLVAPASVLSSRWGAASASAGALLVALIGLVVVDARGSVSARGEPAASCFRFCDSATRGRATSSTGGPRPPLSSAIASVHRISSLTSPPAGRLSASTRRGGAPVRRKSYSSYSSSLTRTSRPEAGPPALGRLSPRARRRASPTRVSLPPRWELMRVRP
jgi:hypothetical protein